MIDITKIANCDPFKNFKDYYIKATKENQNNIQAFNIASFDKRLSDISTRIVNLKYVIDEELIFFSNYNSPKATQFESYPRVAGLFFWSSINIQIRLKGSIKKTSNAFNNEYFSKRDRKKNALSISSHQSKKISSFEEVKISYEKALKGSNLEICPDYWGGFSITPDYFEFWEGGNHRLNKRKSFELENGIWTKSYLEP